MSEEFEIDQLQTNFDFRGFLMKLLSYWPLFLLSLIIGFSIAYYTNVRKLPVYQMTSMISIKDDQNPFFTTTTSLTFNWGGTTDKVNTAMVTLKTRSHNEKVVERLQFYMQYLKQGEYQLENAYAQTPFLVEVDTTGPQVLNKLITIKTKDTATYSLRVSFEEGYYPIQYYGSKERSRIQMPTENFERDFKFGQKVVLPFFNGTIHRSERGIQTGVPYFIRFQNFDGVVGRYRNINIQPESQGSSVLNLRLTGHNKAELVDYLNTTVQVLGEDVLERKNLFATKTIQFIDSTLAIKSGEISEVQDELDDFRSKSSVFDLSSEGQELSSRLRTLDLQKNAIEQQINYYNTLEDYLLSRTDYSDVPAPSVAGINEASIVSGVSRIVSLAEERNKLQYTFREGAPVFADIDRQINAVKAILFENITSTKSLKNREINEINREISQAEIGIRKLPKEQQQLLGIQRRFDLSNQAYNLFLAKRSEAGLVRAANVSDVIIIDPAKDTGGGQVGPNNQLNYVMAAIFGFFIPFVVVFIVVFFDNKIHTTQEISRLSPIPILGVIGKSRKNENLVVLNEPKSAISESFRSIRSSLQFMYKKRGIEGTKTVLVTSSVSGEGKTFCSINIASVFALSDKKTVLLGLDLRKPKIYEDFKINNDIGVVNYLINNANLDEIVQKTDYPNLDVITSGPIPPNPSELILSERMEEMMKELGEIYDYIVLDSPPLALVSDALELVKYADATVYVVRQDYTKKGMLGVINEKHKTGEVKHISYVLNYHRQKAKYGYSYGYGYGYGNDNYGYYSSEKERKSGLLKRIFKRK
jgi:capsular exopolysaccharide synthesis family protein